MQVLLPAVLTILVSPVVLLNAFGDGSTSTAGRFLLGIVVALTATSVFCAIMMLRRSAWARRWLLLLSSVIVVAQFSAYELTEVPDRQLTAVYHAGVMILAVLALSSPVATAWCRPEGQSIVRS